MNGPIRRLAVAVMVGFGCLAIAVTVIQFLAADSLRADPRNPRVALSEAGRERGVIVDRAGVVLAESNENGQGFVRNYPLGDLFAYPVGHVTLLFGERGLEESRADQLRSREDLTVSDVLAAALGRDLRPQSIRLTLDAALQEVARQALNGQAGAVVALDPTTGAVLAYVSSPTFDPNDLLGTDPGPGDAIAAAPGEPLLDRVAGNSYPPGSTFKLIVSAAALESGLAIPSTELPDPRELELPGSVETIENANGRVCNDGVSVTLEQALRSSCNTVFAQLGLDLGAGPIEGQAAAFGFGRDIPFEWNVLDSVFPSPGSFDFDEAGLAQSAIGERDVQATPLQMALVAAGIANNGVIMRPQLVDAVFDADGNEVEVFEPLAWQNATSPATALLLAEMMEGVVASGTGTRAAVPGVRVAGKTGTAENENGPPHAWFVGFAPIENPRIALAVVVESGGDAGEAASGGSVAAPIARALFEYWLEN